MKISVAMCTYNGERFVEAQIASILAQSRPVDEIVIRDDRSSDGTIAVVERLAAEAPVPIRWAVNDANVGSTRNFEGAIAACTGDIIFLADQDDVWLPHKVEAMAGAFQRVPALGVAFSDLVVVDERLDPRSYTMFEYLRFTPEERERLNAGSGWDLLLHRFLATGAAMAFRRELVPRLLPIPPGSKLMIHDRWILLAAAATSRVLALDEPLVLYRQHGAQQIGSEIETRDVNGFGLRIHHEWVDYYDALWTRFVETGASRDRPGFAAAFADRREHLKRRLALPTHRSRRLMAVLKEARTGRYGRYSSGLRSIVRDIASPL